MEDRRRGRIKQNLSGRQVKRIDILPDDVLLEIFDFYMPGIPHLIRYKAETEAWQSLVHVCQRWRNIVLRSPRRLNLRLYCTPETPVRDTLDVWPALPLIVSGRMAPSGTGDIIAALEQSNRVCQVALSLAGRQLEEVLAAMQVPFPELTRLGLFSEDDETQPVIPDSFLDGSAPRLRYFLLSGIPFPRLQNVILSATHLVQLSLDDIPHFGYISPEVMVTLLSVLSSLEILFLGFQSPQSHPNLETRRLPPSKRSVIPALDLFIFKGVIEYLEELVTSMDTPRLGRMEITFFNQIDFDCPRLAQFINRTLTPRALDKAQLQFYDGAAQVTLRPRTYKHVFRGLLINISCREPDWQLSSIEQVCTSSFRPLPTVEDLYMDHQYSELVWKNDVIESTLWLQLLLSFTAVKNLYLSKEFAPGIAAALQELVGGRITEVLPSLENIFVEGLETSKRFQEDIGKFVAARQLSGHPIVISVWVPWVDAIKDDVEAHFKFNLNLVDDVEAQKDARLASATTMEERVAIEQEYDASMADIRAQACTEFKHRIEAERERGLQGNYDGEGALTAEQYSIMEGIIRENMMRREASLLM